MKAVILAGGLGTRFAEETDLKPKPMIEIGGKPILWHIMKLDSAHGIDQLPKHERAADHGAYRQLAGQSLDYAAGLPERQSRIRDHADHMIGMARPERHREKCSSAPRAANRCPKGTWVPLREPGMLADRGVQFKLMSKRAIKNTRNFHLMKVSCIYADPNASSDPCRPQRPGAA